MLVLSSREVDIRRLPTEKQKSLKGPVLYYRVASIHQRYYSPYQGHVVADSQISVRGLGASPIIAKGFTLILPGFYTTGCDADKSPQVRRQRPILNEGRNHFVNILRGFKATIPPRSLPLLFVLGDALIQSAKCRVLYARGLLPRSSVWRLDEVELKLAIRPLSVTGRL